MRPPARRNFDQKGTYFIRDKDIETLEQRDLIWTLGCGTRTVVKLTMLP
jgi:hypothetical protein